MFQLSGGVENLRLQICKIKLVSGGTLPYALLEEGIAMLSSVLKQRAGDSGQHCHLCGPLPAVPNSSHPRRTGVSAEHLEWRQYEQAGQIQTVFETIKQLIDAPAETDPPSVEQCGNELNSRSSLPEFASANGEMPEQFTGLQVVFVMRIGTRGYSSKPGIAPRLDN